MSPSGKRIIKDNNNSPTTPKSLNKNTNNMLLSSCASPLNRKKEAVEGLEEDIKGKGEKKKKKKKSVIDLG